MTPDEITKLRDMCNSATPGPWDCGGGYNEPDGSDEQWSNASGAVILESYDYEGYSSGIKIRDADAAFIAAAREAAREAVPKLLDALDAAERGRDQWEQSWNDQVSVTTVRIAERDTARAQVETLAVALRFYADRDNWTYPYSDDMEPGDICEKGALVDSGDRARAALKAAELDNTSGESK